jgi:hypothetical protein
MSWERYHTDVRLVSGTGVEYDLPLQKLSVKAKPYSRTGSTTTELFDGRYKQRIDGWRIEATLSWSELPTADHEGFVDMIEDLALSGIDVEFDPDLADVTGAPAKRVNGMVFSRLDEALEAAFDGRVRSRPSSFDLVTSEPIPEPQLSNYSWLTS